MNFNIVMCFVLFLIVYSVHCVNGITNDHTATSGLLSVVDKKGKELNEAESRDPRDPLPEYYRGTTATSSSDRDRYGNRYGDKGDFVTSRYTPRPTDSTGLTSSYNSYNNNNNRDRIGSGTAFGFTSNSINRYGTSGNDLHNPSWATGNGYGYIPGGTYDSHRATYGPPTPIDPSLYNTGYNYNYNQYPNSPYPDIQDSAYDYQGYGSPYGTSGYHGKDLTKKVLLPLAGAALLGVAAALVANPVLLQLGVTSGKRKRRDVTDMAQNLAYKGQQKS